ncbi:recombinase family protein [Sphingosinicellaceae bacterium]|nr:recombinase family protein [Sphingosinicellaceae bacterium]
MTKYVAYCRVSTTKQGHSGLGLEAQEAAISAYLKPGDVVITPTFVEVESGKRNERPELAKALSYAKLTGSTLLVSKLDRLSRNTSFLLTLIDGGVEVAFCDLPTVGGASGRYLLTCMVAVAELEAGLTSERTKAALKAAKARGKVLGGYRAAAPKVDPSLGRAARSAKAAAFAGRIRVVVEELQALGVSGLAATARSLNERGIPTPRGGLWTATQVTRVLG